MPSARYDLIIRDALLIDGSGAAPVRGDLAVSDDRIADLGALGKVTGAREISGTGLALAPGFIDTHTHDDRALLSDPLMACKASQGVTTVITGNCGVSLAPLSLDRRPPPPLDLIGEEPRQFFARFADFLGALDADPPALNAACLVGHSSLRVGAMPELDRPATEPEIRRMQERLQEALDAGAIGLSTGLFYAPAAKATTEEVIAIAAPLKAFGALHTTHMRDEGDHVVDSINETLAIGRRAGIPVVISHHKLSGQRNHGRSTETLALIDRARREQPLGLDVYPYIASSSVLDARRFANAAKVIITWSRTHPECSGQELTGIARRFGCSLAEAAERLQPAGAVYFMMSEADVQKVLAYPWSMIGSDGLPHDVHPHPRLWGTFPRVLGHYARDVGLFPLAEAVRRMTALPAAQFGLKDRGSLRPGAYADLVLFSPDKIIDRATFAEPRLPAAGIALVMVNGRAVWRDGASTGERPGRALRRGTLAMAHDKATPAG